MRVLLLGGTGMLSKDTCDALINHGNEVYMVNRGRNAHFINPEAHLIVSDIRKETVDEIRLKLHNLRFDVVIDYLTFTVKQLQKTLLVIKGLFTHYIFISSATVYTLPKNHEKITEHTPIENDLWDYASNKAECEGWLRKNAAQIHYTIVRPYVTYGKSRIPFALIPDEQFTLLNRIRSGKPMALWDGGRAICTLTHTRDFATGIIGLLMNEKAYGEAVHITTDEHLTWREVYGIICRGLGVPEYSVDIPSDFIARELPEYKGILFGDKGRDMIFDNSKIKSIVRDFSCKISPREGIAESIRFYCMNEYMQKINYKWDARIDSMIEKYLRDNGNNIDKKLLSLKTYHQNISVKDRLIYWVSRNSLSYQMVRISKKWLMSILKK